MTPLDKLKGSRTTFKTRLTKLKNWLDTHGPEATVELIERKLEAITEKFPEWEESNASLLEQDEENKDANDTEADTIENDYDMLVAKLRGLVKQKTQPILQPTGPQATAPTPSQHTRFDMKLPEIRLPKFDGRFECYRPFKDQFNARIGNNDSMEKVTALQYLQSCLTGEAAHAIKVLEMTNENYVTAWTLLDKKFDNPRQALRRHCSLLLNVGKGIRDGNKKHTDLVNAMRQQLRSVSKFGNAEAQLNGIINTIILDQLDEDLIFQWETLVDGNEMPKYEDLLEFLEKRGFCAKSAETTKIINKEANNRARAPHRRPRQVTSSEARQGLRAS